ncbi:MAG: ATP-binding protein [Candidatus Cloacimonetes bacterium]|nr:ATP-binding protein [Candidatus Cloacimonadota bacterium]
MNFKDNETFKEFGITNVDKMDFQNFNIVIGENGSGKSRFLKAVKKHYKEQQEIYSVVYAYFPDISVSYIQGKEQKLDIPLKKIIFENASIDFDDFLKYIEKHGYLFLEELVHDITLSERYSSVEKDEKIIELIQYINSITNSLLNRNLILSDNKIKLSPINNSEDAIEKKQERSDLLKDILPELSPGELMLLYMTFFIVAIKYYNKDKDKKLIIILDEPECHLHPKVLIEFINFLKKDCTFEQSWIATHSIFILPLVKFNEIIYIANSELQKRNSKYFENILESVVGSNKSIAQFLLSSRLWQYQNFVAECFVLPQEVKQMNLNDEQLNKFLKFVESQVSYKQLNILDYGGGKGRLGIFIEEKKKQKVINSINYSIYDKYILPEEKEYPFTYFTITPRKKSYLIVL